MNPTRPWPTTLQHPDEFSAERFGVPLSSFIAIAAAPLLRRLKPDFDNPESVLFVPAKYFAPTKFSVDVTNTVIEALTFRPIPGSPESAQSTYWSLIDVADRPLFHCGTEVMTASSLRYGLERATTGVFWMLHTSHEGNVGVLTEYYGFLFEDYCVNVARGMAKKTLTVSGEMFYGSKARRVRSSDVLISTQSTRRIGGHVFVECRAGRPRRAVFESGSVAAFEGYLDDVMKKLGQLDQCIRDHINRVAGFEIDGDVARRCDTYIPVLVLDEPFEWTQGFGGLLDALIRDKRLFRGGKTS